jgi:4'-phosphopantetheinyl transferase
MSATVPVLVEHCTVQDLPSTIDLPTEVIHLWSACIDPQHDPAVTLSSLLSPDEQTRAQRYIVAKARRQFVEVRGLLRMLLGSYLQKDPASIEFIYSDNGKPSLSTIVGRDWLQFNISHSQEQVLYAFSTAQAIGVDIEGINPLISYIDLAHRICTPQEQNVFDQLPASPSFL